MCNVHKQKHVKRSVGSGLEAALVYTSSRSSRRMHKVEHTWNICNWRIRAFGMADDMLRQTSMIISIAVALLKSLSMCGRTWICFMWCWCFMVLPCHVSPIAHCWRDSRSTTFEGRCQGCQELHWTPVADTHTHTHNTQTPDHLVFMAYMGQKMAASDLLKAVREQADQVRRLWSCRWGRRQVER